MSVFVSQTSFMLFKSNFASYKTNIHLNEMDEYAYYSTLKFNNLQPHTQLKIRGKLRNYQKSQGENRGL